MSNVILIEDNTTRQQEEYIGEPLSSFSDVLYNAIDNKYNKLFDTFKEEIIDLPYDVVIVHESAFLGYKTSIVEQLKDYCKLNKKTLVFFSGGVGRMLFLSIPRLMSSIKSSIVSTPKP